MGTEQKFEVEGGIVGVGSTEEEVHKVGDKTDGSKVETGVAWVFGEDVSDGLKGGGTTWERTVIGNGNGRVIRELSEGVIGEDFKEEAKGNKDSSNTARRDI